MFSLKVILIFCTISCFSSTSGEPSPIKKSAKTVNLFFQKVKNLDKRLQTPPAMNDFGTIKYTVGSKSITCSKEFLTEFRTEYEKLATISTKVVTNYVAQIDTIFQSGSVGDESGRNKLCNYYSNDLIPQTVLDGEGTKDATIIATQKKLRDSLREIYNKICCKSGTTSPTSNSYRYKPQPISSNQSSSGGRSWLCLLCFAVCLDP